jgi:Asp-tRNA(Asn)/Glu-tRNA(Gln) amidotransferase C subunit
MSQPIDLETMRRVAGLAGFEWSDAELEAIRPLVDASLRMLAGLETLPLDEVEPTMQYRML